MINTFLPKKIEDNPQIKKIMECVAKNIYKNPLFCTYRDSEFKIDSKEKMFHFLTAKDFYDYKFDMGDPFWKDFRSIAGQSKVKSIFNKKATGTGVKDFIKKYDHNKYESQYHKLDCYKDTNMTIKSVVEKSGITELANWRKIESIFDYDKLGNNERHTVLSLMDVPVCPYCNMNYTISFQKNGKVKTTADLDHFYPKSEYPYYALCLYNFVPACPVCNSRMKLDAKTEKDKYIFPNEDSFKDKAEFEIENLIGLILGKDKKCNLKLNNYSKDERVKNSMELFQLQERYEFFDSYAKELLEKVIIYNESYRDELKDLIFKGVDITSMIFGTDKDEEEYAKESLGKLRMDLLKQLGIYD